MTDAGKPKRKWQGKNGDKLAWIVWPERALAHLMVVRDHRTLCNCSTFGPCVAIGEPCDYETCPGCCERLSMLKQVQIVMPSLSQVGPHNRQAVCVLCGQPIGDDEPWYGSHRPGDEWFAGFAVSDLDLAHAHCGRGKAEAFPPAIVAKDYFLSEREDGIQ